ncbi:MAG: hypothetical protein QOD63_1854 [Actinomycetota bacterium]|jgi:hypothetical protein|nr:hypothetical protein [Actinomycetota bacterium]
MPSIVEASPDYLERLFIECDHPLIRGGFWIRHRNGVPPFEPQGFAVGVALPAQVKDGQWVVRCDGCRNAQFTARAEPRFFCVRCLNSTHGGQWVAVAWPVDSEKGEAVLLARPLFQSRNWLAGETLADLVAENRAHRDPVPEGVA